MAKRKHKPEWLDLVVSVVMTVTVDPEHEDVGTYSVGFDVNGPEGAVAIVRAAYQSGALNRGIDAYIKAVARTLAEPTPRMSAGSVGRA